ncbi:RNA polymerase II transcription initiation factor TFIIA, large chain [Handroanthus impetiginosus]|uniref:RNA polymerase II transcription initiation factor TFIIA, large chain n=1 Tax=Handroanthus impetiginosus TaxID=429701 RepID=A0A2G9HG55_9LAMI|nr:RNA polymerase II transcription initiation factor TFIIA, large chain [Handroanthus impetiginosus]
MSTIVCQNLVSRFESQLTETTTTFKLKLAAPPPPPAPAALDFCKKDYPPVEIKTNLDFGNWSFLQTLSLSKGTGDYEESSYTHPLAKNSSFSRLSAKSLELCTENLGSETGTDTITDSSTIFSSVPPENSTSQIRVINNTIPNKDPKSNSGGKIKNFPPPLTTMSGSSSLQVRRYREGGRLIIEAVEAPFRNSYLQAERSDGRLRLCFLTAETASSTAGGEEEEEEAEPEEEEEEIGDECGGDTAEEEEIEEPRCEMESEVEEFDGEINLEMGIEKFQRLSRCKEGGHGSSSDWNAALWVATS